MASAVILPRRILKETQRLLEEPVPGISATPYEDNLRYFNVVIGGPLTSPYESKFMGVMNVKDGDYGIYDGRGERRKMRREKVGFCGYSVDIFIVGYM